MWYVLSINFLVVMDQCRDMVPMVGDSFWGEPEKNSSTGPLFEALCRGAATLV
jgi:hypothetical protein